MINSGLGKILTGSWQRKLGRRMWFLPLLVLHCQNVLWTHISEHAYRLRWAVAILASLAPTKPLPIFTWLYFTCFSCVFSHQYCSSSWWRWQFCFCWRRQNITNMERYDYHLQLEFVFHCKVRQGQIDCLFDFEFQSPVAWNRSWNSLTSQMISFDWIKTSISIRQFLAW